ncbi:MAG TPA: right-handed parallel beta-helix repeat-containing protein [Acidimicrobiales bacterium]|nr:right-handed parallel beta-helix repeat-containing protein [Acidimicrobiales bacterium]
MALIGLRAARTARRFRRLQRLRSFAALGAVAAMGGALSLSVPVPAGAAATGGTLYVTSGGTDSGTCRLHTHPCATIAYAISQANPNSTISVGAGTYTQQLVISQNLTIVGSAGQTVIEPTTLSTADTDTDSTTPQYAIIDVTPGVNVTLKGLTVNGTNAESQFDSCADNFIGVYFHDASGTMTKDTVTDIELPQADFGCQDGVGVYVASDSSGTSAVSMDHVTVNAYDKNGITCDDTNTTCSVTHSMVTGIGPTPLIAQNGIQIWGDSSATISDDTVSANSYSNASNADGNQATGLLLLDAGTLSVTNNKVSNSDINIYAGDAYTGIIPTATPGTWTISQNKISGATDNITGGSPGYGDGVQLDSTTNPVTVTQNTIKGSAENGISLLGVSNATVSANMTSINDGDGIYVGGPGTSVTTGSSGNTVSGNTSRSNTRAGIMADTGTGTNTVSANTVARNVTYDLEDLGTGNTWSGNTCVPQFDSKGVGLCGG